MSQPLTGTMHTELRHGPAVYVQPPSVPELIRLENITKTYHLGDVQVPVLKGVSLVIRRGEMVALMGASGSGKTTLMNILGCLDRPSSGRFWLDGQEMSQLTPDQRAVVRIMKLGFVFQSFNLLPRTSALQNVVMPLDYALPRPTHHESHQRADELLEQLGLAERSDHEPSQMSGGQQQRVAIARALVNRPALILADEPTGNLDSRTGDEILRMFQRLNAQGITIVLVTHDLKVARYAHRMIRIVDGLIAAEKSNVRRERKQRPDKNVDGTRRVPESRARRVRPALPHDPAALPEQEPSAAHQPPPQDTSPPQTAVTLSQREAGPRRKSLGHFLPPIVHTAFGNLRRNKTRSALTALGVIIGVGAVIAMTEIGEGSRSAIDKTIASMGAYKIPIFPSAAKNAGVSQGAGTVQTLRPSNVDEILRQCPAVSEVVPMVWARAQVVYGRKNWVPQSLTGTGPRYLAIRDWEDIEEGDNFTEDNVRKMSAVCLVGQTVRRELFEDQSPIGATIRIRNVPFRVVGLLSAAGRTCRARTRTTRSSPLGRRSSTA